MTRPKPSHRPYYHGPYPVALRRSGLLGTSGVLWCFVPEETAWTHTKQYRGVGSVCQGESDREDVVCDVPIWQHRLGTFTILPRTSRPRTGIQPLYPGYSALSTGISRGSAIYLRQSMRPSQMLRQGRRH